MIIQKFLHSCLLIEENGKKLLIDPGWFCFIENKLKPEDIGPVDAILLTHKHPDHYYPEALKWFVSKRKTRIICNQEISELLRKENMEYEIIKENETKTIEGFIIQAFEAPHGCLPTEVPHNLAFLINNKLLHPGDSFDVKNIPEIVMLALPVFGPWATLTDALEFAKKAKPRIAIPIHDAIIKDFMLERMYAIICKPFLEKNNIEFRTPDLGEKIII